MVINVGIADPLSLYFFSFFILRGFTFLIIFLIFFLFINFITRGAKSVNLISNLCALPS